MSIYCIFCSKIWRRAANSAKLHSQLLASALLISKGPQKGTNCAVLCRFMFQSNWQVGILGSLVDICGVLAWSSDISNDQAAPINQKICKTDPCSCPCLLCMPSPKPSGNFYFFRNKTFLFFKIESWTFQVHFEIYFGKPCKISTQSDNQ